MDFWSTEQVQEMSRLGNMRSNRQFEHLLARHDNRRPSPSSHIDDRAPFIRAKYADKAFCHGGSGQIAPRLQQGEDGKFSNLDAVGLANVEVSLGDSYSENNGSNMNGNVTLK